MTTRTFSTAAVLSLTTGRLLCNFGDMHELAEWVAGHPIWTHEFADPALWTRLKLSVLADYPQLADVDASGVNKTNHAEFTAAAVERFGQQLAITAGTSKRTESPLDSAARMFGDKPIVAIVK